MKKLLLFAGLPGVGKSTISRAVSDGMGVRVIDIDDFKKVIIDPSVVTKQIDPPELRWRCYEKALEHIFSNIFSKGETSVLMDEVFHLRKLRERLELFCNQRGVEVFWVEVRCSYGTIARRLNKNERKGHILSTEDALNMHLMFGEIFESFQGNLVNHLYVSNDDCDIEMIVSSIASFADLQPAISP